MSHIMNQGALIPVCLPVRDMKDTAKFAAIVESANEPVIVTKNGYSQFVVMKTTEYEAMQEQVAKAKLLERIAKAELELASDDYVDAFDFTAEMREKYDL